MTRVLLPNLMSRRFSTNINQAASCFTDVPRTEKEGDAIGGVTRSASEGVVDMIGTMTGACEVGQNVASWTGAGEPGWEVRD